ncbi:sperm-associated antigen 1-like [Physella acuta]|uniref:sperm-associated antigen 1-like n=1 Tax=Physella acuta TaxID=109671 RepID=UPI0027DE46BB|nr:sperm-associated antigen 1-like [Physella acuta]XP_059163262.1 sperm-associated antigen 1-like [Physella acuta]XP_059163263.1 sperm-associated antigen 1-like [Physella acuta]XP_059163264.1 sperm-associated antigen 1-like [Physella acuta]
MSNIHLEGQTSKKYDIPLSHLDYAYIEKCTDVKELEKIIRILRSGDEGKYPELEKCAEKRLLTLNPKSRVLRQEGPILRPGDLSSGDWKQIEDDLKNWTNSMSDKDLKKTVKTAKDNEKDIEVDENLPPVRSNNVILEGKKQKKISEDKTKKKVLPRDPKEWDKFDIEAELKKVDSEEVKDKTPGKPKMNGVSPEIDTTGLSEEEKQIKANREKDKGNEAFGSKDFEESVTYYSRSISLMPTAASYNNRALAYLKLEKWDQAINDCNSVLNLEANNIKALLRRGTAFKSKKNYPKALVDFEKVLAVEPNNKKAQDLLEEVNVEKLKLEKEKKEKGRRMVIEEVEDGEDECEEVEIEKPVVNGLGPDKTDHKQATSTEGAQMTKETTAMCEQPDDQVTQSTCVVPEPIPSHDSLKDNCKDHTTTGPAPSKMPSTSALDSSLSEQSLQNSPKVSFTLEDDAADQETTAASPPVISPAANQQYSRPEFIQLPLSSEILESKENGNSFFRSGQYGDAVDQYSNAISKLKKDPEQIVNLSVLLSNRAACHLKTGNCSLAITDCSEALQLVPHGTKTLLRRAMAYENMEKYAEAYVDYKHVLSIDKSTELAHQGASRCQGMLQQQNGSSWRKNLPPLVFVQPWEVPVILDQAGLHTSLSSSSSLVDKETTKVSPLHQVSEATAQNLATSTSETKEKVKDFPTPEVKEAANNCTKEPIKFTKEEEFERLKTQGNLHVQKGEHLDAVNCYSQCIGLCPDQIASYTNRALCYLKLNMATEASNDCDKALSMQADNPKALYRRALARKMLLQYKASLQDLVELLKLEPKNSAAQKEMDTVKMAYKEELEKLKAKKVEKETKTRKRMKIEEIEDDEEEEKPPRAKATEKSKSQNKSRNVKTSQTTSGSKAKTNSEKQKMNEPSNKVTPPIAPRLMKTTPYEFCQAWNSLKSCQGIQPYAEILRQVAPVDLPTVISNKLDGQMLQIIVRCVYEEMVLKGEIDTGFEILDNLCKVPRFSTVSMFMNSKEKKEVSAVLEILSKTTSNVYTSADVVRLKKEYSVK